MAPGRGCGHGGAAAGQGIVGERDQDDSRGDCHGEPEPAATGAGTHPRSRRVQDPRQRRRAAALAATQSRANPNLTLADARDHGVGERYQPDGDAGRPHSVRGGPRHDHGSQRACRCPPRPRPSLLIDRTRLQSERDAAVAAGSARRGSARGGFERRALARETRCFRTSRSGLSAKPTRPRACALEAEAARGRALPPHRVRIELAAAIARRWAPGLLPQ